MCNVIDAYIDAGACEYRYRLDKKLIKHQLNFKSITSFMCDSLSPFKPIKLINSFHFLPLSNKTD